MYTHAKKSKRACPQHSRLRGGRGFTMIETLVAITILLLSITAPLTIASRGLSATFFARDQITAFYLAQEAVEYVRNTRDENILKGSEWLDRLGPCTNPSSCTIDVPNDKVKNCPPGLGPCEALLYDSTSHFYNHDFGNPSKFTRSVQLESINDDESVITVTISWTTGVLSRSFSVKEDIFNWQ